MAADIDGKQIINATFNTKNVNTIDDGEGTIFWCKPFTLSIVNGSYGTVSRDSTSEPSAETGTLSNGATIYYGDVLSASANAQTTQYTYSVSPTSLTVDSDETFTFSRSLRSYTVAITLNAGIKSITLNNVTYTSNSSVSLSYGTYNWSIALEEGYTRSSTTGTLDVYGDTTLAPSANRITFTVSFLLGGSNYGSWSSPTTFTAQYGDWVQRNGNTVTIYKWDNPTATRNGSTFTNGSATGYTYSVEYTNAPTTKTQLNRSDTYNITATTSRTANTYSITYVMNSGTHSGTYATQYTFNPNVQTVSIGTASRTGYSISSIDPSAGTIGGYNTTLTIPASQTGGITVTYNWSINTYTLTITKNTNISRIYYKVNGASSWSSTNASTTVTFNYGTNIYWYATCDTGYTTQYNSSSNYATITTPNQATEISPTATPTSYTITLTNAKTSGWSIYDGWGWRVVTKTAYYNDKLQVSNNTLTCYQGQTSTTRWAEDFTVPADTSYYHYPVTYTPNSVNTGLTVTGAIEITGTLDRVLRSYSVSFSKASSSQVGHWSSNSFNANAGWILKLDGDEVDCYTDSTWSTLMYSSYYSISAQEKETGYSYSTSYDGITSDSRGQAVLSNTDITATVTKTPKTYTIQSYTIAGGTVGWSATGMGVYRSTINADYGSTVYWKITPEAGFDAPSPSSGSVVLNTTNFDLDETDPSVRKATYTGSAIQNCTVHTYTITFSTTGGNYGSWTNSTKTSYYNDKITRWRDTITCSYIDSQLQQEVERWTNVFIPSTGYDATQYTINGEPYSSAYAVQSDGIVVSAVVARQSFTTTLSVVNYGSWTSGVDTTTYYGDTISRVGNTITCYKWDSPSTIRWTSTYTPPTNTKQWTYSVSYSSITSPAYAAQTITATGSRSLTPYTIQFALGGSNYGSWTPSSELAGTAYYGDRLYLTGNTVYCEYEGTLGWVERWHYTFTNGSATGYTYSVSYTNISNIPVDVDGVAVTSGYTITAVTSRVRTSYTITFTQSRNDGATLPDGWGWDNGSKTAYYGDIMKLSGNTVTCYKWDATTTARWTNTFTGRTDTSYYHYSLSYTPAKLSTTGVTVSGASTVNGYETMSYQTYTITFQTQPNNWGSWSSSALQATAGDRLVGFDNRVECSYREIIGDTSTWVERWTNTFTPISTTGYTYTPSYSTITPTVSSAQTITATVSRTKNKYPVYISAGTGVSSVYLSNNPTATSGSSSGSSFEYESTVYGFVQLSSGYSPQSGWQTVGSNKYNIGSLTVNTSGNDFGTISAALPKLSQPTVNVYKDADKVLYVSVVNTNVVSCEINIDSYEVMDESSNEGTLTNVDFPETVYAGSTNGGYFNSDVNINVAFMTIHLSASGYQDSDSYTGSYGV